MPLAIMKKVMVAVVMTLEMIEITSNMTTFDSNKKCSDSHGRDGVGSASGGDGGSHGSSNSGDNGCSNGSNNNVGGINGGGIIILLKISSVDERVINIVTLLTKSQYCYKLQ